MIRGPQSYAGLRDRAWGNSRLHWRTQQASEPFPVMSGVTEHEAQRSPLNVVKRGHANGPNRSSLSTAWYPGRTDEHRIKRGTCLRPESSPSRLLCAGTGLRAAALYCCQSRQGCGWQRCKRGRRGGRLWSNRWKCGARRGYWRHYGRRCRRRPSGRPALGWPMLLIAQPENLRKVRR
jgi:hypothetical protein